MGNANGYFTVGESRFWLFLRGCFFTELDRAALMPLVALGVRLGRECGGREVGRKQCTGVGMFQCPVANSELENRDMNLRFEEDLNGLPSREALHGESRYRRRSVVVFAREAHMLAALYLVNVRDGLRRHLGEETWVGWLVDEHVLLDRLFRLTIKVVASIFIESGQLWRRQKLIVLVANFVNLPKSVSKSCRKRASLQARSASSKVAYNIKGDCFQQSLEERSRLWDRFMVVE